MTKFYPLVYLVLLLTALSMGCDKEKVLPDIDQTPFVPSLPAGFPDVVSPPDNQLTQARVALGKKLFYDPILSIDSTVACASCHKQALAFADEGAVSKGVKGRLGFRNSPTLANVAYLPLLMKDGGAETLELQVLTPIADHAEMDFTIGGAAKRLQNSPAYIQMSYKAYNQAPSPFVITRALAAFQRTILSGNAPADKPETLTPQQQNGKQLFFGKANCAQCHNGFNYTNNGFANNGLYEMYPDSGRFRITQRPADMGVFRIPSLRNVALTPPYMHNGSLQTLQEVITHYNTGGKQHPNKSPILQPLGLSENEKYNLLQFLQALTDSTLLTNKTFKPD